MITEQIMMLGTGSNMLIELQKNQIYFLNGVFRDLMLIFDSYVFRSLRKVFPLPNVGACLCATGLGPSLPPPPIDNNPHRLLWVVLWGWGAELAGLNSRLRQLGRRGGRFSNSVLHAWFKPSPPHQMGAFSDQRRRAAPFVPLPFKLQRCLSPDQKIKAPSRIPNQLVLRVWNVPEKSICSSHHYFYLPFILNTYSFRSAKVNKWRIYRV